MGWRNPRLLSIQQQQQQRRQFSQIHRMSAAVVLEESATRQLSQSMPYTKTRLEDKVDVRQCRDL